MLAKHRTVKTKTNSYPATNSDLTTECWNRWLWLSTHSRISLIGWFSQNWHRGKKPQKVRTSLLGDHIAPPLPHFRPRGPEYPYKYAVVVVAVVLLNFGKLLRGLLITPGWSVHRAAIHLSDSLLGVHVRLFIVARNVSHSICSSLSLMKQLIRFQHI